MPKNGTLFTFPSLASGAAQPSHLPLGTPVYNPVPPTSPAHGGAEKHQVVPSKAKLILSKNVRSTNTEFGGMKMPKVPQKEPKHRRPNRKPMGKTAIAADGTSAADVYDSKNPLNSVPLQPLAVNMVGNSHYHFNPQQGFQTLPVVPGYDVSNLYAFVGQTGFHQQNVVVQPPCAASAPYTGSHPSLGSPIKFRGSSQRADVFATSCAAIGYPLKSQAARIIEPYNRSVVQGSNLAATIIPRSAQSSQRPDVTPHQQAASTTASYIPALKRNAAGIDDSPPEPFIQTPSPPTAFPFPQILGNDFSQSSRLFANPNGQFAGGMPSAARPAEEFKDDFSDWVNWE